MQNRSFLYIAGATLGALLLFGATRTRAADTATGIQASTPSRLIRVSGTAVVYGKPDYATIVIGVSKTSPRVMESKTACDDSMRKVQDALKKAGIAQDDIQTTSYEIFPIQPQGKPTPARQWKVAHHITVKVRKVASVAPVIDAAVTNGATDVSQVQYSIEKVLDLRSKARAEAMRVARAKAEELARLGNVQLGEPMTISDNAYEGYMAQSVANISSDYGIAGRSAESTVSGGQIAISAREEIEYAIR